MKKTVMLAVLIGLGWASASHAVVISWSAKTVGTVVPDFAAAQLVYVSSGEWNWAEFAVNDSKYSPLELITGRPILADGSGVRQQATADYGTPAAGGIYYVVLFQNADRSGTMYRSTATADWGISTAITTDILNPKDGLFIAGGSDGSGWNVVPEPNTFALLALGAAALAARRRRKL
jgi:hypothetical protein